MKLHEENGLIIGMIYAYIENTSIHPLNICRQTCLTERQKKRTLPLYGYREPAFQKRTPRQKNRRGIVPMPGLSAHLPRLTEGAAIAAMAAFVTLAACGAATQTRERDYAFKAYIRGSSSKENLSMEKIDGHPSYESHFTLEKVEECVKITIIARNTALISAYVDPTVRAYFVLEKAVDVSRFNPRAGRIVYTEIARNFDINWKSERDTVVCSRTEDPLKKLTPGAYRIRLCVFDAREFGFSIAIATNEAQAITPAQAEGGPP